MNTELLTLEDIKFEWLDSSLTESLEIFIQNNYNQLYDEQLGFVGYERLLGQRL